MMSNSAENNMNVDDREEMSVDNDDFGVDPIVYSCLQPPIDDICKDDLKKQLEALSASNNENVDSNQSLNVPFVSSVKVADFASEVLLNKNSEALNLISDKNTSDALNARDQDQTYSIHETPRSISSSIKSPTCQSLTKSDIKEVRGTIAEDWGTISSKEKCVARHEDKLKEEVNDDEKKVINNEEVLATLEQDTNPLDYAKSSDAVDCKDDLLNATNNPDDKSSKDVDETECKLFVYNPTFNPDVTKDIVYNIFNEYGVVTCCRKKHSKKKQIFHVTFEDIDISIKLKKINKVILKHQFRIRVRKTPDPSTISAEFRLKTIHKKPDIMNIFSNFGAIKYCKKGVDESETKRNRNGFYLSFEEERVNKMLLDEGSIDYDGYKILIKQEVYIEVPLSNDLGSKTFIPKFWLDL